VVSRCTVKVGEGRRSYTDLYNNLFDLS